MNENTTNGGAGHTGIIAVVGMGKIGLPIAANLVLHGHHVIGCDTNPSVVAAINSGECHISGEPGLQTAVTDAVQRGMLTATTDTTNAVRQSRVVIVVVPVLIDDKFQPDLRAIDSASAAIATGLTKGTLVVYVTTLPVGSTSKHFGPLLEERSGLKVGRDFYLAFSPERVRSGQILRDLATYPKVVGGVDAQSAAVAIAFYRTAVDADIRPMSSADAAEYVKLIENAYRDVNIALANEFARTADRYGLDVQEAIDTANSQPLSNIHQPGVGVGGHCIPVYPYFLLYDNEDDLRLLRQARAINDGMGEYVADRLESITGSLATHTVLILGVAYRGGVREVAFTSARLIRQALERRGARVYAHDPLFSTSELVDFGYRPLTQAHEPAISAIVLQAAHPEYQHLDFSRFPACKVLLDGRQALNRDTIERQGIAYLAVGDGGGAHPGLLRATPRLKPAHSSLDTTSSPVPSPSLRR